MDYPIQLYILVGFFISVALAIILGFTVLRIKSK